MEEHKKKICSNCGMQLHGKYCSHCGQEDIDYIVSMKNLIPEILHEFLGFDSQIFKSLPLLLFKPGYLTNEFNSGRREKYIPPVRMYLLISLIFFLVLSFDKEPIQISQASQPRSVTIKKDTSNTSSGNKADTIIVQNDSLTDTTAGLYFGMERDPITGKPKRHFHMHEKGLDTNSIIGGALNSLGKKFVSLQATDKEFRDAFENHYPETMFFLLPVCALLLKLLYIRRKRLYVEHLIFSLHVHSFAFIVLIIATGIGFLTGSTITELVACVIIAVYLFIALKKVYKQSFVKTGIKYFLFAGSYLAMISVAIVALFLITIMML